jgi:hypothetical protein
MRRQFITVLLATIASTALAQSPAPPKKSSPPANRTKSTPAPTTSGLGLCVVSLTSHKFEVQTIGLTVFGNSLEAADITTWGLDDLIVRKVSAIAGSRFAVRRLVLNKVGLSAYEAPRKSISKEALYFAMQTKSLSICSRKPLVAD